MNKSIMYKEYMNLLQQIKVELYRKMVETDNVQLYDYVRFCMPIATAYKVGDGWKGAMAQAALFHEEVRNLPNVLADMNLQIEEGHDGACDTLYVPNTPISMYMHPMEISGCAKAEQLTDIQSAVASMGSVKEVGAVAFDNVFDLSDYAYRKLLAKITPEIWEAALLAKELGNLYDFPFDFARYCRLPRASDSCGYCSTDTDIEFVDNLVTAIKAFDRKVEDDRWSDRMIGAVDASKAAYPQERFSKFELGDIVYVHEYCEEGIVVGDGYGDERSVLFEDGIVREIVDLEDMENTGRHTCAVKYMLNRLNPVEEEDDE